MKIVLTVMVLIFTLIGVAMAATPKVAITYNLDSNDVGEAVGASVTEDVLGIKNLDYDILIASGRNSTLADDEKVVINGLSYNYDVTEKLSIGIGAGLGIDRFEKFEAHRLGEMDKFIFASGSYLF